MYKLNNFNYAIEMWLFVKRILGQMNEYWTWNRGTWLQNPTTNYLLYLDKRLDPSEVSFSISKAETRRPHSRNRSRNSGGGPAVGALISPLGDSGEFSSLRTPGVQFPKLIEHTKRVLENFVCVWLQVWAPKQPPTYMKTIPVYSRVLESVLKS